MSRRLRILSSGSSLLIASIPCLSVGICRCLIYTCSAHRDPQRVMLTGGAGFIGSHLAEALLRRGVDLTIVDNLDHFYPPAWKKDNLEKFAM
jgi:NADPH-dependent 2,4-dienoyl-CoA reductase/sulfur reductase-like enzyme